MSEVKKVTDEELQEIKDLGTNYQAIANSFGQLRVQKLLLEQQLSTLEENEASLEAKYIENQEKEREVLQNFNEKYGRGTLNPQTGEFTPQEQEKIEEKIEEK
tara:strand:- start:54 stop:362 length:309 start_codon:yes stop_codon:yes gene_type:complete